MKRVFPRGTAILIVAMLAACNADDDQVAAPEAAPEAAADEAPTGAAEPPAEARRAVLEKELGVLMRSFGSTVASVSDHATWEPAKKQLQRIEARTIEITTELRTLPQPAAEEVQASRLTMKRNEDDLEKALGDKDTFIQALPEDVGRQLMEAAGRFSSTMGTAQQALYGAGGR